MALDPHQYEYRSRTFGNGTDVLVERFPEGLRGGDYRMADRELPRGHGAIPGLHTAPARDVVLTLVSTIDKFHADTAALMDTMDDLAAVFAVSSDPGVDRKFRFNLPSWGERFLYARPAGHSTPDVRGNLLRFRGALTCADPRIYGPDEHVATIPIYTPTTGGGDYPGDYPKDLTASGTLERVVTNAGRGHANPTFSLAKAPGSIGQASSVTLTNRTTGDVLEVVTPIGPGQTLTWRGRAFVTATGEQVLTLDGASRYGDWQHPREPFRLAPGDNVIRMEVGGDTDGVKGWLTYRDTWM